VRRVQPLWEQKLKPLDHRLYEMPFKPDGRVPPKERHPLPLLESALNPPPDSAWERRNAKDLETRRGEPYPTQRTVRAPPWVPEVRSLAHHGLGLWGRCRERR